MSTFGKKSLCWWDYDNHSRENAVRYSHTPKELQLKILETWYPVGARFKIKNRRIFDLFEIKSYVEQNGTWCIDYEHVDIGKRVARFRTITPINPVYVAMEPETLVPLKRSFRLDKLLNSKKDYPELE